VPAATNNLTIYVILGRRMLSRLRALPHNRSKFPLMGSPRRPIVSEVSSSSLGAHVQAWPQEPGAVFARDLSGGHDIS